MSWRNKSLMLSWKCSECGSERTHGPRSGGISTLPFNFHQKTCSAKCARARKTRLQADRRQQRMFSIHTPETIAAIRRAGFPEFTPEPSCIDRKKRTGSVSRVEV